MVKRSDYITNSVRCQGTVIFLNKMKGESGRLVPVEKLASSSFFYGKMRYNRRAQSPVEKLSQALVAFSCRSSNIGLNIKPLNFMKLNRQEYDLIYDAFQYMDFKMTKDQKRLAEQILDSAFYPEVLQEVTK